MLAGFFPTFSCIIRVWRFSLFDLVQGFEVYFEVGLSAEDISALWTGMDFHLARVLLLFVAKEGAPALENFAAIVAQENILFDTSLLQNVTAPLANTGLQSARVARK